jgi:hypothetical protein
LRECLAANFAGACYWLMGVVFKPTSSAAKFLTGSLNRLTAMGAKWQLFHSYILLVGSAFLTEGQGWMPSEPTDSRRVIKPSLALT